MKNHWAIYQGGDLVGSYQGEWADAKLYALQRWGIGSIVSELVRCDSCGVEADTDDVRNEDWGNECVQCAEARTKEDMRQYGWMARAPKIAGPLREGELEAARRLKDGDGTEEDEKLCYDEEVL